MSDVAWPGSSDRAGPGGVLVIGVGSPDRGDDAVGREVAGAVAALGLPGVAVSEHEDPTDLVEAWSGAFAAVVVDAVCSGALPGSVSVLEVGADSAALPRSAWARTGRGGTHALGLASAVELSRALRRLPARLWVVGVEAARFEHGLPLSAPVAASVPEAVRRVVALVELSCEVPASGGGCADVPR